MSAVGSQPIQTMAMSFTKVMLTSQITPAYAIEIWHMEQILPDTPDNANDIRIVLVEACGIGKFSKR